jgi:hypothetical protein
MTCYYRKVLSRKSPGLIWYEREEANLLDRYRTGEIDFRQFFAALMSTLTRASSAMRDTELQKVLRGVFLATNTVTDLLAKFGHPLPGNDPLRPN